MVQVALAMVGLNGEGSSIVAPLVKFDVSVIIGHFEMYVSPILAHAVKELVQTQCWNAVAHLNVWLVLIVAAAAVLRQRLPLDPCYLGYWEDPLGC